MRIQIQRRMQIFFLWILNILKQEDEEAYEYSQKRNREKNNGNKRKTTPSMKRLMDRQVAKQTAPLVRNDVFGKVRLEPELLVRDGELSVSFRIGTSLHMYVLKHVLAFEEHMPGAGGIFLWKEAGLYPYERSL